MPALEQRGVNPGSRNPPGGVCLTKHCPSLQRFSHDPGLRGSIRPIALPFKEERKHYITLSIKHCAREIHTYKPPITRQVNSLNANPPRCQAPLPQTHLLRETSHSQTTLPPRPEDERHPSVPSPTPADTHSHRETATITC